LVLDKEEEMANGRSLLLGLAKKPERN